MNVLPTMLLYTHGTPPEDGQEPRHEIVYVNLTQVEEVRVRQVRPQDLTWEQALKQKKVREVLQIRTVQGHMHIIDKPADVDLALAILGQATVLTYVR